MLYCQLFCVVVFPPARSVPDAGHGGDGDIAMASNADSPVLGGIGMLSNASGDDVNTPASVTEIPLSNDSIQGM